MPLHALRHTAAATWLSTGHSLIFVARQLGHRSITTTEQHYGHLAPDPLLNGTDSRTSPRTRPTSRTDAAEPSRPARTSSTTCCTLTRMRFPRAGLRSITRPRRRRRGSAASESISLRRDDGAERDEPAAAAVARLGTGRDGREARRTLAACALCQRPPPGSHPHHRRVQGRSQLLPHARAPRATERVQADARDRGCDAPRANRGQALCRPDESATDDVGAWFHLSWGPRPPRCGSQWTSTPSNRWLDARAVDPRAAR
jgi:hypothetical protein